MAQRSNTFIGLWALLLGLVLCAPAAAFKLITEEEASLPDDLFEDRLRDPFPGPVIDIMGCPQEEFAFPVELTLELRSFAGATIDLDSLRVVYLKQPKINLTARIREANAIRQASDQRVVIAIHNAEVPPGQHHLQVWARDTRNKDNAVYLKLDVAARQGKPVWSWTANAARRSRFAADAGCP